MEKLKAMILQWCIEQTVHNIRNVPPPVLRVMKAKLTCFNATTGLWDCHQKRKDKGDSHVQTVHQD